MKASHRFLTSAIYLCMGAPYVQAAGLLTIGGTETNVTGSPVFSPLNYALDAVVSETSVVNALATNPTVTVTNSGPGGAGINIISPVTWTNANTLVVQAHDGINVSANLSNFFGGGLSLVADNGGVALNGVVEFTGSISVQATAGITQDNAHILRADGLATFDAGTSDITLAGPENNFGSLSLTGNAVTIREASSTSLAGVNAGSLDLTSSGAITQTGAVNVTGLAEFDAGANNITLTNAGNNFGTVGLTGTTVSLTELGDTDLGTVNATTLTVNSGGALTNSGPVTVTGAADLNATSINLGGGAGTASLGSLHFNATGNASFSLLSGTTITGANTAGSFIWNTNGTASLAPGATITATSAEFQQGTVALSANNQIVAGDLTLQSGATFNLGAFNNTVGTYNQNGAAILAGTGTLTATTYNLNGGNVNANLGTGTLNQIGTTTTFLNGTSAASAVNVNGGTLALGSSNRLSDSAAVAINSGRLNLVGFSDTVGTFAINTGILDGTGTLTASSYTLNGGTVNANLGAGTLTQIGNTTILNGSSASATVNVNGGTLELGASNRLLDSAALTLNTGTLNLGAFNDTVGTFSLNSGNLNGTGTLTATSYTLNGGTVNANLGAGILTQTGNTTLLNGTSASVDVNINGGSLTLGASDRLHNSAAVKIAGGSLNLAGFNDTVGTFAINTGTLDGTGTLTAATYNLSGGAINANLGAGVLTQIVNTTILGGTSGAATVNINGGTLALGASDRLSDSAAVTLSGTGILNLGAFNDTVGSFTLNDGTLNGTGTLTAATYNLNGGTLNGNLGAGILSQLTGTTLLNGTSAAETVNINGGTLTLGASNRLADSAAVTVASTGTLNLGASNDTVGSFTLNGGLLNGTGTLTATTYDLNGGTVNANLGTGTLRQIGNTTLLNGTSGASVVQVNGGTLTLGASNRLSDSAAVAVNSAILNIGSFNDTVGSFTLNGGSLNGSGTLTASTYDLNGGTVNANLGTGTLNQLTNSTLLNGTSAASLVNVNGGTLTLGSSNRLFDSAAVTVNSGTLDLGTFNDTVGSFLLNSGTLNGSGTLTASTYALNGGTVNANLGSGTVNQIGNTTLLNGTSAASVVNVNGGTLTLGASDRLADNAAVTVNSAILNLGIFSDTVGSFTLNSGTLDGSGTLTAATYDLNGGTVNANLGAGILNQIGNATLLNGTSAASVVNVNSGTLTLGASDRFSDSAAVTVGSAILDIVGFSDTVGSFTLNGGMLNGTGTLSAATYDLNGGTVNANLGAGILNQLSNTTTLNGASSAATVNITGGNLTLGASERLADNAAVTLGSAILNIGGFDETVGGFTLNGGTLDGSGTLSAATYDLNGGTVNANLGAGILSQLSNTTTLNGTSSAATVNVNGGTLALGASNRLADNAAVTVGNATLDLVTFDDTVGSFALNGGILNGSGTLTAATYDLNGGTVNANLGAGILTQIGNSTLLNGTSSAATVNINGGTLTLGASDRLLDTADLAIASATLDIGAFNDTVGTFTLNGGMLNGSGTLTAATYDLNGGTVNANLGTGILTQLTNSTQLNGSSAAGTVNVNGGTLTLGASDRLADSAAVTVGNAILDLVTFDDTVGSFTLNGGMLNGSGTLTAATYDLNGGTVNANLGNGILTQLSNTTTLNGTSSAATVNVSGGTLTLGASDRLADSAAVTVGNAILDLVTFNDTVGSFTLNGGMLNGSGTLTAATYDLNGGTVNASLGAGILTQLSNNTLLNGTSSAATVDINGGTLTLGASHRLSDSAAVTVNSAILDLVTFDDTVGSFALNGGTLDGTGTLTAATYGLNGGTVNANLGTGVLTQIGNTTLLNGSSAAGTVDINGGTLTLGASSRLADSAAVTVNSAILDLTTFSDTVGSFALNGGMLNGSGTLTAATYGLNGGTVNANLGTGVLTQIGNTTLLNGTSAAGTVDVNGGTLTLGASNRLSDSAAVTVNSAILDIATFSDTVGSFTLNGGTLGGSGTLTAATYGLNGGTVNANLGTGALTQIGNTTILNGTSSAGTVDVNGGTLVLGASNRLADTAAVSIAAAGTLDLGAFSDTVGSFSLNGGILNGSGTLTATTYALNGGTVNANLGTGALTQIGNTTTLNGSSAASTVDVNGGTLALGASNRLADTAAVTIASAGTLDLGAFSDTVGSFTLNGGMLNGSGTLTAATYTLNGGTVNANLGTGILTQLANTTLLNGSSSASTVNIIGGTLALGASDRLANGAAVTVTAATLDLGAFSDTVGTFTLNSGTLDGSGTLTASTYSLNGGTVNANLGTGTLTQLANTTTLNGTSGAAIVNVNGGTLVLGASDRLADTAALTIGSATLDIGGFSDTVGSFTLNGGTLDGSGTLTASTYSLNGGTLNANLGTGTLTQLANTTTLNGTSAAGTVNIQGGTLALGASHRLSDTADVTVNSGTLDIGAFDDAVGSFTLVNGILAGTGNLTATTYNLSGSTVHTDLGSGTLNQIANNTLLLGTSAATSVNINGGTLTLGASERLLDTADLVVNTGAFDLTTFDETVGSFRLNGGMLNGSGTLTAATYTLNGGTVNANLGDGILTHIGNSTLLNGTSSASSLDITGGTLTLGASDRLSDTADLMVGPGTLNLGAFSDTVGTFTLNGGTLDGTGTLIASTYDLNGGLVKANLGAGTLNQLSNTTTLQGTSGALDVNILGGTLALGGSDRLANNATVTVESAGTLDVRVSSDVVENLILNGGTINGSGTLTATIYNLAGGTVNAKLGTGTLNQLSGTTLLNGTSAAHEVNITGGTLALGASARLSVGSAVTLGAGTLDLGAFSDTVGSFTLAGGTLAGTGTLSAASYSLYGGDIHANLGTGTLTQVSGTTNLNGSSAATRVNVNGGTLALGASNRLADSADLRIAGGTLSLGTFSDSVGSFLLDGGILDGSGTLTATTYKLLGGTVNANLGTGSLFQTASNTLLNGKSAADYVNVFGGTLTLGSSNLLSDSSILRVGTGTLDLGAFDDKVNTLRLNKGTIVGTGALTASTYRLNGGTIEADLGKGTLKQLGGRTLFTGSSAARRVKITDGTLDLGKTGLLADKAKVFVSGTAKLDAGAADDVVASYIQEDRGKLTGKGELTVDKFAKLTGGKVSGSLTGPIAVQGDVKVTGDLAGSLKVNRGTLTLNGDADANTSVKRGASLFGTGTIDGNLKNFGNLAVNAKGKDLTVTGGLLNKGTITLSLKNKKTFESIKAGSVKFGGNLVVVNTGSGLKAGQEVRLFKAGSYAKHFKSLVAVGFKNTVAFDEETGKLVGLGKGESSENSKLLTALPADSTKSATASTKKSLRIAKMPVAAEAATDGARPLKALAAMPVAKAAKVASPGDYRGVADYTEQALRSHVLAATEQAPVARAGDTQGFATTSYHTSGVDASANGAGYEIDSVSVTAGVIHDFGSGIMLGGLFGFDDGDVRGDLVDSDSSGFAFGAFGSYLLDESSQTTLSASATYGVYDHDTTRQSAGGRFTADGVGSDAFELSLGVSTVAWEKDGFRVTPGATFRYIHGGVDSFRETGPGAALAVQSQDIDSPLLDLGVDFDYVVRPGFTLAGHLGYMFDLNGSGESVTASGTAAGATPFSVGVPGIDNDAFILGAGAFYDINDSLRVGITYRGEFRSSDSDSYHSVGIGASLSF
ncbi:MAG: hypothetical protein H7A48_12395 [Akkermansiaceae bacterium]|nr:hypothetical protein [Akkermansiaceae bacterium]